MTSSMSMASPLSKIFFFVIGATTFAAAFSPKPSISPPRSTPSRSTRCPSVRAVREATFGMGCFWEPAESLLKRPGVLATTAGYTGAPPDKPPPTYDSVCFGSDWVEAVRVAYDDESVSYDELLDHFFELQKPGYSRQYASIIFADGATERGEAERWRREGAHDAVGIEPPSAFYRAEEYHQRYWEKQRLRLLVGIALIAGESGAYDGLVGGAFDRLGLGLSFDGVCGALFLAGAAWTLVERAVARDVRELKPGDLIAAAQQSSG